MRLTSGLVAAALAAGGLVLLPAPAAHAVEADCLQTTADSEATDPVRRSSVPLDQMQVLQAHRLMAGLEEPVVAGTGIGVAVIDSGIRTEEGELEATAIDTGLSQVPNQVPYYQGTVVAGLIAGQPREPGDEDTLPVGIAPGADLYDVRVYDAPPQSSTSTEDLAPPSADSVLAGLEQVLEIVRDRPGSLSGAPIKIVNVSMQVPPDQDIEAAVEALTKEGVLVVASSGDRPTDPETAGSYADYAGNGTPPPGEDAAQDVAPASSGDAIAVTASGQLGEDVSASVLRNSQTDLAAPTVGGVSFALTGQTCIVPVTSASLATAEVSGALALLWSYLGEGTPAGRVRAVLERTATGNDDGRGTPENPALGYGVVQPLEAITSSLDGKGDDLPTLETDVAGDEPATAPEPEEDVLASTRRNAVWWGLVGGSVLVVALILRPLLARRRD